MPFLVLAAPGRTVLGRRLDAWWKDVVAVDVIYVVVVVVAAVVDVAVDVAGGVVDGVVVIVADVVVVGVCCWWCGPGCQS